MKVGVSWVDVWVMIGVLLVVISCSRLGLVILVNSEMINGFVVDLVKND